MVKNHKIILETGEVIEITATQAVAASQAAAQGRPLRINGRPIKPSEIIDIQKTVNKLNPNKYRKQWLDVYARNKQLMVAGAKPEWTLRNGKVVRLPEFWKTKP